MINEQINNYKIIEILGEGGMANVYLAEHLSLRNSVAIKILKPEFVHHPNIRNRFLAEARNLAQLDHPNIIKVVDLIDAGDIVAFVMEYIEGTTLENYLMQHVRLSDDLLELIFQQMIDSVNYIHSKGLIHRDIKPSNFMLTSDNKVKLLDFGIAKNTNDLELDYTKTGLSQQMGTPLYMSPEQITNTSQVTKQSDIYSLGVVLWQMVMNKKPYNTRVLTLPEIQVSILKEPLPLTNTPWDKIIEQATVKDLNKRTLMSLQKIRFTDSIIVDNQRKYKIEKKTGKNIFYVLTAIIIVYLIIIISFNNNSSKYDKTATGIIYEGKHQVRKLPTEVAKYDSINLKSVDNVDEKVDQLKLQIGQRHEGGIIFFLDQNGTHGKVCTENDLGKYNLHDAINFCENYTCSQGYSDWHLPKEDDLRKIYHRLCKSKKIEFSDLYWYQQEKNGVSDYNGFCNFSSWECETIHISYPLNVRAIRSF